MRFVRLFLVVLFASALPALAYEPATIAELEQVLAAAHGKSDKALAKQLGELELTERLSTLRLEKLQAVVPGDKSRQALLVLSDTSAFHNLPAAEVPQLAAPDSDTQSKILNRTKDYIQTLHGLIDIVVSRDTARFENLKIVSFAGSAVPTAAKPEATVTEALANAGTGMVLSVASAVVENQPYHLIDKTGETVTYRNGAEEVVAPEKNPRAPKPPPPSGLSNWGVFGPLLEILVNDISIGKTDWGHWEQGRKSALAVFRYDVPQDQSNYDVQYCCFTSGRDWDGPSQKELWNVYETLPSYHGEIAVDPETGAILRLTLQTDIPPGEPIYRADFLVEYGSVELGMREYLLPNRSVSISGAFVPVRVNEGSCVDFHCTPVVFVHPKDIVVRDTVYHSYHAFRGETHTLPEDASAPAGDSPSSSQPQNQAPRKQTP